MAPSSRLTKILIRWGIIVLGLYLGLCVAAWYYQPKLLYFPLLDIDDTPAENGMPYEDLWLFTGDGVRINAWYVPAADKPETRATVLFSHGNGGNISHRIATLEILHRLGLNVLIYDYHGYGRSEGAPSEQATYLDAEAAWKYLVETRGVPPGRIVLFGRSLGGAVAAYLAETHASDGPAGLIIESSFTSVPDMADKFYPWLPTRAICRYQYNTLARMKNIRCPILVVHSPQDELVPYAMGKKLFEAAAEPKRFVPMTGGHNDGFLLTGQPYVEALDGYFRSIAGQGAPERP